MWYKWYKFENGSVIYNNRPSVSECSNNTWTSISAYTKEGIMYEQEYKGFEGSTLTGLIHDISINSMLFIPREGSKAGNFFADGISDHIYHENVLQNFRGEYLRGRRG